MHANEKKRVFGWIIHSKTRLEGHKLHILHYYPEKSVSSPPPAPPKAQRRSCRRHKKTSEQSGLCSDVVPVAGLEPAWITPPHFECGASASFATPAGATMDYSK